MRGKLMKVKLIYAQESFNYLLKLNISSQQVVFFSPPHICDNKKCCPACPVKTEKCILVYCSLYLNIIGVHQIVTGYI